jgi:hypothetical protein
MRPNDARTGYAEPVTPSAGPHALRAKGGLPAVHNARQSMSDQIEKRLAMRYIPKDSTPITREGTTAVVYVQRREGRIFAIGYRHNTKNHAFNYRYKDEAQLDRHVTEFLDGEVKRLAEREQHKAAKSAEQKNFRTSLKVGDVLHYSWGYEQTNCEFYEVVEVSPSGKSVMIRRIAGAIVPGSEGYMSESLTAARGHYIGERMRKPVKPGFGSSGDRVPMKFGSATLWSGRPMTSTHYA